MSKSKLQEMENAHVWRDIYESRQTNKILTDEITAIEVHNDMPNAIIFKNGIKILIPQHEIGVKEVTEKKLYGMVASSIDYVIIAINTKDEMAVASRRKAMEIRQLELPNLQVGSKIKGRIVAVGKTAVYAEAYGVECRLKQQDISYGYMEDLRNYLSVGDELDMIIKQINLETKEMALSIKEASPDPFVNIDKKIIQNNDYVGVVTGIVDYGIFVNINNIKGLDALCPHPGFTNLKLSLGDKVLVKVKEIKPEERKIRAYIERLLKRGN